MITEKILHPGLKTQVLGRTVYSFETIDSTNTCAKAVAAAGGPEGAIVIAEEQTAGKGRLGRTWEAASHQNLTFSIVLRHRLPSDNLKILPFATAVGLAEAIEDTYGLPARCKWPNDLLIRSRKVAGILIEGSVREGIVDNVVVGVGINVNQEIFPPHLGATSLRIEMHKEVDRVALLKGILLSLENRYNDMTSAGPKEVIRDWLKRAQMLNEEITVFHGTQETKGTMRGISDDGGLVIETVTGKRIFHAGDATLAHDANRTFNRH